MRQQAATARPRYSRIAAAGTSVMVTAVAVLGAAGLLPTTQSAEAAPVGEDGAPSRALASLASAPLLTLEPSQLRPPGPPGTGSTDTLVPALPRASGEGRRVVFDMTAQRVWLVSARDRVVRSYLVSGSLTNNLAPGSYQVYSKSRDAVGVDDSGTMKFMVRFTHGKRAAIGFHDIPVREGERVQTREQLGTPQSHGCIRQLRKDARALWEFAPIGTAVVVVS